MTLEYHEFPLPFDCKLGKHTIVIGETGAGKSNILLNLYAYSPNRSIYYNTIGLIEVERASDIVLDETSISSLKDLLEKKKVRKICISPTDDVINNTMELMSLWQTICSITFIHEDKEYTQLRESQGFVKGKDFKRRGNVELYCDEMMWVCQDEKMVPANESILLRGRNYKISLIMGAQRNQNISKKVTTQTFHKFLMSIDEYDVHALQGKVKHIELIPYLAEFHFIYYNKKLKNNPIFCKPLPLMLDE